MKGPEVLLLALPTSKAKQYVRVGFICIVADGMSSFRSCKCIPIGMLKRMLALFPCASSSLRGCWFLQLNCFP